MGNLGEDLSSDFSNILAAATSRTASWINPVKMIGRNWKKTDIHFKVHLEIYIQHVFKDSVQYSKMAQNVKVAMVLPQ